MANITTERAEASRLTALLWVTVLVYGIHVMEEHAFNWAAWAQGMGLGFDWSDFYVTNAEVIIVGVCAASIAWRMPSMGLAIPGLMVVNGLLFHLVPTLLRLRPNPGFLSALFLFAPLSLYIFRGALREGLASRRQVLWAIGVGAALQALPLVLLALKPTLGY